MTWNRSPAGGGSAVTVDHSDDTGLARLRELGYRQELKRDLSYVPRHLRQLSPSFFR
jgi:hypothetical protein